MTTEFEFPHAYDLASVMAESNVGKTTVYKEIASGRLIARKCRGRTIVLREDFLSWLNSLPTIQLKSTIANLKHEE